MFVIESLCY
ncbi:transcriptional regulator domain protein, partial [Vibrio parahaemolyticus V-223/04]